VKKIKDTAEFTALPSKLCRYCLFKSFCPKVEEVQNLLKSPFEEYPEDLPF